MVLEYDGTWITQISSFCEWVGMSFIKKIYEEKHVFEEHILREKIEKIV